MVGFVDPLLVSLILMILEPMVRLASQFFGQSLHDLG